MLRALLYVLIPVSILMWIASEMLGDGKPSTSSRMDSADEAYIEAIRPLLQEWDDAVALASSTPRMGLPDQVASLQEIRRRLTALEPGKCTGKAHETLSGVFNLTINSLLSFMRDADYEAPVGKINRGKTQAFRDLETCVGGYVEQGSPEPPPEPPETVDTQEQQDRIKEIAEKHRKENPIN